MSTPSTRAALPKPAGADAHTRANFNAFIDAVDAAFALETPTAAHIANTATAHGATGAVAGTTNTQTLTNKLMSTGSVWNGTALTVAYLPTAASTIALGTAGTVGTSASVLRTDATIAAFDATSPIASAPGDTASVGSAAFAARRDHRHAREAFAAPAFVLTTAAAAGSAATIVRSDASIALFDATAATTVAPGDAAAAGSAAFAARRDHAHAMSSTVGGVLHAVVHNSGYGLTLERTSATARKYGFAVTGTGDFAFDDITAGVRRWTMVGDGLDIPGSLTVTGVVNGKSGAELGIDGSAGTIPLDFHSSANSNDYDSRIQATGGSGADGDGTLALIAAIVTTSGGLAVTGAITALSGLEVGVDGVANTEVIDFHSSANLNDYDSRIQATGGTGADGAGTLALIAANVTVSAAMTVAGVFTPGSVNSPGAIAGNSLTAVAGITGAGATIAGVVSAGSISATTTIIAGTSVTAGTSVSGATVVASTSVSTPVILSAGAVVEVQDDLKVTGRWHSTPATAQDISGNGQTITVPTNTSAKLITSGGATRTGTILAVGTYDGQRLALLKTDAGDIGFAADATSNVADAVGHSFFGLSLAEFMWNTAAARWFKGT